MASSDPTSNFNFSATAVNPAGSTWLSISGGVNGNYATPQAVTVTAMPADDLAVGTYTARINIKSDDGRQSLIVPVSLTVAPAGSNSFANIEGALAFSMAKGGNAPPWQSVDIANAGSGALHWTASGTTADGGDWLTLRQAVELHRPISASASFQASYRLEG